MTRNRYFLILLTPYTAVLLIYWALDGFGMGKSSYAFDFFQTLYSAPLMLEVMSGVFLAHFPITCALIDGVRPESGCYKSPWRMLREILADLRTKAEQRVDNSKQESQTESLNDVLRSLPWFQVLLMLFLMVSIAFLAIMSLPLLAFLRELKWSAWGDDGKTIS